MTQTTIDFAAFDFASFPSFDDFKAAHAADFDRPYPAGGHGVRPGHGVEFVVFDRIHTADGSPRERVVPLAEAWDVYEALCLDPAIGFASISAAIIVRGDGSMFRTFAKSFSTWDFERGVSRLVRIGIGAGGYDGPQNPALVGLRPTQHYVGGSWTWGYNWSTRNADYREGGWGTLTERERIAQIALGLPVTVDFRGSTIPAIRTRSGRVVTFAHYAGKGFDAAEAEAKAIEIRAQYAEKLGK
jgi:hypothetical protein